MLNNLVFLNCHLSLLCEILKLMIVVLLFCKHINYPFTSLYQYACSSYYSELHISFVTDKKNLCFNHSLRRN